MRYNAKQKRKLDREFSKFILNRDNRTCQRCGKTAINGCKIDVCHIIPREYIELRWEPRNAIACCVLCHKWGKAAWHKNPLMSVRWLETFKSKEELEWLIHQII